MAPCSISCSISSIFLIGMIYFYTMSDKSEIVKKYKSSLTTDLQKRYDNIRKERMNISYQGFILGFVFSLFIIFYNLRIKSSRMNNLSLVCTVIATAFLTNYFYYMLHPKSDWMLDHLKDEQQVKAWLIMYKQMQYNYHMGLVLGIIAIGIFAFAFRC